MGKLTTKEVVAQLYKFELHGYIRINTCILRGNKMFFSSHSIQKKRHPHPTVLLD